MGLELQLEAERLTMVIAPAFVPTIVYNWVSHCVKSVRGNSTFQILYLPTAIRPGSPGSIIDAVRHGGL